MERVNILEFLGKTVSLYEEDVTVSEPCPPIIDKLKLTWKEPRKHLRSTPGIPRIGLSFSSSYVTMSSIYSLQST